MNLLVVVFIGLFELFQFAKPAHANNVVLLISYLADSDPVKIDTNAIAEELASKTHQTTRFVHIDVLTREELKEKLHDALKPGEKIAVLIWSTHGSNITNKDGSNLVSFAPTSGITEEYIFLETLYQDGCYHHDFRKMSETFQGIHGKFQEGALLLFSTCNVMHRGENSQIREEQVRSFQKAFGFSHAHLYLNETAGNLTRVSIFHPLAFAASTAFPTYIYFKSGFEQAVSYFLVMSSASILVLIGIHLYNHFRENQGWVAGFSNSELISLEKSSFWKELKKSIKK